MTGSNACVLVLTSTFPEHNDSSQPDFVLQLSKHLSQTHTLTVLTPDQPGTRQTEDFDDLQVERFRYWIKRYQTLSGNGGILVRLRQNAIRALLIPLFLVAETLAIRRLLKQKRVDLIHAHWLIPQGLCALLGRSLAGCDIPIVVTTHGSDIYAMRWPGMQQLKRWVLNRVDSVAAVSTAMKKDIVAEFGDIRPGIEVLPMGVDLRHRFTPSPLTARKPEQLLFVGRLVAQKGLQHLLGAMQPVVASISACQLLVIGSGPGRSGYQQQVKALGLEKNIKFLGAVSALAVRDSMRESSIVVVPSITGPAGDKEGLGLVAIEALGCGSAVIAHDYAAVHDVITDEKTGLLVAQGNEAALASAIISLLEDPQLQHRLAAAGRTAVLERFDLPAVASAYSKLFERLLDT